MRFRTKEEQKVFEEIIDCFVKEHGEGTLKVVYKLARKLRKEFSISSFPIGHIYHLILSRDFDSIYKSTPLKQIAKSEGIPIRTVYNIFHHCYLPNKKKRRS